MKYLPKKPNKDITDLIQAYLKDCDYDSAKCIYEQIRMLAPKRKPKSYLVKWADGTWSENSKPISVGCVKQYKLYSKAKVCK